MSLAPAFIVGAGMVRFGKHPDTSLSELGAQGVIAALQDAGLPEDLVEVAFVGSQWGGSMVGQRIFKPSVEKKTWKMLF